MELASKYRKEGRITTPGEPFEQADTIEIEGLLGSGVFEFEIFDQVKHGHFRIFKSRMVREIKGKGTESPYEKSRLVIQGYNDDEKKTILTQSPTLQRVSQRLIISLSPTLRQRGIHLSIRDITQAYTQSQSSLKRVIYSHLPTEMKQQYQEGTIIRLLKPLYGIAEAGLHWFSTYFRHHREKLCMSTSTYDPCLLITDSNDQFAIVGIQTDDTLILADDQWLKLEETELTKAGFKAKPKIKLSSKTKLIFNGCVLKQDAENLMLCQKEQGRKLNAVNPNSQDMRSNYVEQRARAAYIASMCQPEATYEMSVAAQHKEPNEENVVNMNKRINWMIKNIDRGLIYIPLNIQTAKVYVFVDG